MHVGFLLLLCAFKLGECQLQPLQSPFGTPISDWLFVIRTSPGWLSRKWPYCGFSTTSPQPETIISCDKGSPPLFSLFTLVSPSGQLPALTGQKLLLVSHTTGLCGTPVDGDRVGAAGSRSSDAAAGAAGDLSTAGRGQDGQGQAERQIVTQQQGQVQQQQEAGGRQQVQQQRQALQQQVHQQAKQQQPEQAQQHEGQQKQQQHQKPGQEGRQQQQQQQGYQEADSVTWPVLAQRYGAAVNRSAVSCRTNPTETAPPGFQLLPQDLSTGLPIDLDSGVVYYLLEGDKFCAVVDTDQAKASLVCDLNTTSGAMRFSLLPAAMPSAALTSLASSNRCGIKSLLLPPPHDFMCLAGRTSRETDSINPIASITSTASLPRSKHSGHVVRDSLQTWDVAGGGGRLRETTESKSARSTLSRQVGRWWGWSETTDTAATEAGADAVPAVRIPIIGRPGLAGPLQPWKRIPEQDMEGIHPLGLDPGMKPAAHSLSTVFADLGNRVQRWLWMLCTWVWGSERCRGAAAEGGPQGQPSERDYTFTLLLQKPGSRLGSGSVVAMVTYSPGLVGFPLQQCCPELDSPHVVDCGVAGGDPLPSECWFTLYKINGKSGEPIRDGDLITIQSKAFSRYCSITSDGTLLCVSVSSSNASRNLFRYEQVLDPGHILRRP